MQRPYKWIPLCELRPTEKSSEDSARHSGRLKLPRGWQGHNTWYHLWLDTDYEVVCWEETKPADNDEVKMRRISGLVDSLQHRTINAQIPPSRRLLAQLLYDYLKVVKKPFEFAQLDLYRISPDTLGEVGSLDTSGSPHFGSGGPDDDGFGGPSSSLSVVIIHVN